MGSSTGGGFSGQRRHDVGRADGPERDGPAGQRQGISSVPDFFLGENELTRQKAAYEEKVKGRTNEKGAEESAEPVYTLPENSTLVGSRAMTALLGRVPINGTVTDPYPFKVLIGKDNLTANGIELPDVEGAIVSGRPAETGHCPVCAGRLTASPLSFPTVRYAPSPDPTPVTTPAGKIITLRLNRIPAPVAVSADFG